MRKWISLISVLALVLTLMSFRSSYTSLWKKVDASVEKSQLKEAINVLNEIKEKAIKDKPKGFGHFIKAYLRSNRLAATIGTQTEEQGIRQLENYLSSSVEAPDQKAIIHYLLLREYCGYIEKNGYLFRRRTDLSDADSIATDMKLWSINQFKSKILEHLNASFDNPQVLLTTSSKNYQPLTNSSNFGFIFNNDLYHILLRGSIKAMREAASSLRFYYDIDEYVELLLDGAIKDYAGNDRAIAVLELDKLRYKKGRSPKEARGYKVLKDYIDRYEDLDVVVEAVDLLLDRANDSDLLPVEKKHLAQKYIDKYPKYLRIDILKNQLKRIEEPSISLCTEEQLYPGMDAITDLWYKNVDNISLDLYKVADEERLSLRDSTLNDHFLREYGELVSSKVLDNLSTSDYQQKFMDEVDFKVPSIGYFVLKVNAKKMKEPLFFGIVSSNIKTTLLNTPTGVDLVTLDAKTGLPLEGVAVSLSIEGRESIEFVKYTDEKGFLSLNNLRRRWNNITVRKGSDVSLFNKKVYLYSPAPNRETKDVVYGTILSDRGVYRPGQKIYLKGYVYKRDNKGGFDVYSNYKDDVSITDASGAEITKLPIETNEYGTFSIEYVLPKQILVGPFGINLPNIAFKRLRVEEYKRPTFELSLEQVQGAYSNGDKLRVQGRVDAFDGSLLKGAKLTVDVKRGEHVLPFCILPKGADKMLSHDVLELSSDGIFEVEIDTEGFNGPMGIDVSVSLTTLGGETQRKHKKITTNDRPFYSYITMQTSLEKEDSIRFSIQTTNYDDVAVDVDGKYILYREVEKGNYEKVVETGYKSNTVASPDWSSRPSGTYKLEGEFVYKGDTIKSDKTFTLFSMRDKVIPTSQKKWLYVKKNTFAEGSSALFAYGVSQSDVKVNFMYYTKEGLVKFDQKTLSKEMRAFEIPYDKIYGDEVQIVILYAKGNEIEFESLRLVKEKEEHPIHLKWSSFRDRLKPGSKEKWTLNVDGDKRDLEVLALMYDASLDQIAKTSYTVFKPYNRSKLRTISYRDISREFLKFCREAVFVYPYIEKIPDFNFDTFWYEPLVRSRYTRSSNYYDGGMMLEVIDSKQPAASIEEESTIAVSKVKDKNVESLSSNENIRQNFAETAFFLPNLYPDRKGRIHIEFESPEQLTKWAFKALAHDKKMNVGSLEAAAYTVKDFSISPQVPRFIREGDKMYITSIVKNGTDKKRLITVKVTWFNPQTNKVLVTTKERITVEANDESAIQTPTPSVEGVTNIGFRIEAASSKYSDGEQHVLAVLADKEQLSDGFSIFNYEKGNYRYAINQLFNGTSTTATNKTLSLEFSSDPIWFAVSPLLKIWSANQGGALEVVNRLYADMVGYDLQRNYGDYLSLYKENSFKGTLFENEELLDVAIQETPWHLQGLKQQILLGQFSRLVDENANISAVRTLIHKLKELQNSDGGWEWYNGLGSNNYITSSILRTLLDVSDYEYASYFRADLESMMCKAIGYLLAQNKNDKSEKDFSKNLTLDNLNLLYALSKNREFFDRITPSDAVAIKKMISFIPKVLPSSIQKRALAAQVLLYRGSKGDRKEANLFIKSLRDPILYDKSGLAYYGGTQFDNLSISSQLISHIEAAQAIFMAERDVELLNKMKAWVVMKLQRQSSWNPFITSKILTFLSLNSDIDIDIDAETIIKVAGKTFILDKKAPYIKENITLNRDVDLTDIEVIKKIDSSLWGGVTSRYLENLENIVSGGGEVKVVQKLYKEVTSDTKVELIPVEKSEIHVGDIIVSRIEFTLNETLDYLQLKVDRAGCLEPFNKTSGYNYSLRYLGNQYYPNGRHIPAYTSIRDASTLYFYNTLEAGTYVLENRSYVSRSGSYHAGIVRLQSVYAPEISAHSKSIIFRVR